ncbi:hypothetical protein TrVE_jg1761 [Triparma verrucosa]|uniref:RimM N-terminal domain-containing protein n=1 Tax=Triparma verrucosa TaxID=1606542 RepID=A0A9W7CMZ1_9STRA|nr:hypothetical protein TrVE_jg1761 [Triparma verrucosa]
MHLSVASNNDPNNDPDSTNSDPSKKPRRVRKNKYASKSQTPSIDPMESLLAESALKNSLLNSPSSSPPPPPSITKQPTHFPPPQTINPSAPETFGFTYLGYITSPHSLHGYCKLKSETSFPSSRLLSPGYLGLKPSNKKYPRERLLVKGKRMTKEGDVYLLKFEGIDKREDAERIKGHEVWVREERDEEVKEELGDGFMVKDLINLNVYRVEDSNGEDSIGVVESVALASDLHPQGLGSDLLDVKLNSGLNCYVPFVKEIVPRVKIKVGVWVEPPDGLLDLAVEKEEKVRIRGLLPGSSSVSSENQLKI